MAPLENMGGTIKDESDGKLEAALARALDRATREGQWDVVRGILEALGGRGRG